MTEIEKVLLGNDVKKKRALFSFDDSDSDAAVIFKFNLWARYSFPKYFSSRDAEFHKDIDAYNLQTYRGELKSFIDVGYRGCAKTARTKLFAGYCIANDRQHYRRYIKVLSSDLANAKQVVTDVYNMLIHARVSKIYPEIFQKTKAKREETMGSFTTSTGIKVTADTVGTEQRGQLQDDARPDWILFEDFETRKTLRSGKTTRSIWDNMEEARTGLSKDGACIYNCNYLSEMGNVHKLVTKETSQRVVLITPILDKSNRPTWSRYTIAEIEQMKVDDEDFEGERMCKPSASKDIFFDREMLEKQIAKTPIKTSAGFKIFHPFDPSHRFGSGHDVGGGVALDASTSVYIDFDTIPARVVATFKNNLIKPDNFGDEINRESQIYGECLTAIEKNNHGHATIARAKQLEVNQYQTQAKDVTINGKPRKEYGWHTNTLTKPKMLYAFAKAVSDGLIECSDPDLIEEAKAYTRNDLIETVTDPRETTRHFDLLVAACIAWQMKDHAVLPDPGRLAEKRKNSELHKEAVDNGPNPFHYTEED